MDPSIGPIALRLLYALGAISAAVMVGAPLAGVPNVVRLSAVPVSALLLLILILRPWRWTSAQWDRISSWSPSPRVFLTGALIVGVVLFWLVLTRFQSGSINAVDFTVYFDRPCHQTIHGRPLWVETADSVEYSNRSALAHHAYWAMLPICSLYAIHPTPYWLLALSAISVTFGAAYVVRVMQAVGAGGVLATATGLAFVLNDNTARTLSYGFHPEVLYAWFIPWLLYSGLRSRPLSFLAATVACVLVKEDAVLSIFAASVALGLLSYRSMTGGDRLLYLLFPLSLAVANLLAYYLVVLPLLTPDGQPVYAAFWASYGSSPTEMLTGMLGHPWAVASAVATSGLFWTVLRPHLFLSAVGWRWTLGAVPIAVLLGASDDPQLRAFGLYYSIPLVPFLAIGASVGASALTRRLFASDVRASLTAAAVVLLGAIVVAGASGGYSLRPWRRQVADLPAALAELPAESFVLVQSALYPHAGYDERVRLLTPETLGDPRYADATVITAPGLGTYPLQPEDQVTMTRRLSPVLVRSSGLVLAAPAVSYAAIHTHLNRTRSRFTLGLGQCAQPGGCLDGRMGGRR
jgi:uncharacterized membrane protein